MIGIIDYGMGNLHSVQKALDQIGAEASIICEPDQITQADKVILPGVGAFQDAIRTLQKKELVGPIREAAQSGKWFLGICLGLQLLFEASYEDGNHEGLGILSGRVKRFDFADDPTKSHLKIPHMGWNGLKMQGSCPLYKGIEDGAFVYFVHSYYVAPDDPRVIASTTEHGIEFVSSICRDNLMATQFHPEKSQRTGLQILANFAEL